MALNKWNVFRYDINKKQMVHYNVFSHGNFIKDCMRHYDEYVTDQMNLNEFKEAVAREARYYFWAKSEHEILIRAWCGGTGDEEVKVDIYEQLNLNWDAFITQLVIHLELLRMGVEEDEEENN